MSKREFKAEPFTNEFGEVINPGDPVIFAATSWKQTSIQRGVYEGFTLGEEYDWKQKAYVPAVTSVRVRHVNETKKVWKMLDGKYQNVDTGKPVYSILILKRVYRSAEGLVGKTL